MCHFGDLTYSPLSFMFNILKAAVSTGLKAKSSNLCTHWTNKVKPIHKLIKKLNVAHYFCHSYPKYSKK